MLSYEPRRTIADGRENNVNENVLKNTLVILNQQFTWGVFFGVLEESVSQFTCSVMSNSLRPQGLQHARPPCPSPTPRAYSKSCPLSQWCHPTISSSVVPFSSRLQSFPASKSFPMSKFIASGDQSIGVLASAPVLPMTGLISFTIDWLDLLAVQRSPESSPISQFESVSSSALSLLYGPTHISVHDYWKNPSFDYMNICWQSDVSAF